jgi:hypothetical protein
MESTDAQPFKRGDILALQFADDAEEASWIAKRLNGWSVPSTGIGLTSQRGD